MRLSARCPPLGPSRRTQTRLRFPQRSDVMGCCSPPANSRAPDHPVSEPATALSAASDDGSLTVPAPKAWAAPSARSGLRAPLARRLSATLRVGEASAQSTHPWLCLSTKFGKEIAAPSLAATRQPRPGDDPASASRPDGSQSASHSSPHSTTGWTPSTSMARLSPVGSETPPDRFGRK